MLRIRVRRRRLNSRRLVDIRYLDGREVLSESGREVDFFLSLNTNSKDLYYSAHALPVSLGDSSSIIFEVGKWRYARRTRAVSLGRDGLERTNNFCLVVDLRFPSVS